MVLHVHYHTYVFCCRNTELGQQSGLFCATVYIRQAVTAYERLRLEDSDENWNDSSSTSRVVARPDDDLGTRFSDYVGLAQRVRDNCRQYSDFMQLAVHRETIYRGKF